jgi:quinol monooxygenase YgiN
MIAVIATIETKPGGRAALLEVFKELVPKVLAEKGCLGYGPFIDAETSMPGLPPPRENVVTMIEKWESVAALEAHLKTPHMLAFRKDTEPLRLNLKLQILAPG